MSLLMFTAMAFGGEPEECAVLQGAEAKHCTLSHELEELRAEQAALGDCTVKPPAEQASCEATAASLEKRIAALEKKLEKISRRIEPAVEMEARDLPPPSPTPRQDDDAMDAEDDDE